MTNKKSLPTMEIFSEIGAVIGFTIGINVFTTIVMGSVNSLLALIWLCLFSIAFGSINMYLTFRYKEINIRAQLEYSSLISAGISSKYDGTNSSFLSIRAEAEDISDKYLDDKFNSQRGGILVPLFISSYLMLIIAFIPLLICNFR